MAVSVAAPSPRSEPLLWLQLLALGLLPLEALLLLLLLGASDPGPLPLLERLLCWAIGVLAPAALLWRLPVDPWSLLVAQVPQRGRREIQQRLSALQPPAVLRLGSLVGLLLAAALLALLQWQGQQVVQALWLLSRSPQEVAAVAPLSAAASERERLSPGLPLLLLPPLRESRDSASVASPAPSSASSTAAVRSPQPRAASAPGLPDRLEAAAESPIVSTVPDADPPLRKPEPLPEAAAQAEDDAGEAEDEADLAAADHPSAASLETTPSAPAPEDLPEGFPNPSATAAAVAVEPEQPTEEQQSPSLDQQIS
jgi:hypothetical protein